MSIKFQSIPYTKKTEKKSSCLCKYSVLYLIILHCWQSDCNFLSKLLEFCCIFTRVWVLHIFIWILYFIFTPWQEIYTEHCKCHIKCSMTKAGVTFHSFRLSTAKPDIWIHTPILAPLHTVSDTFWYDWHQDRHLNIKILQFLHLPLQDVKNLATEILSIAITTSW